MMRARRTTSIMQLTRDSSAVNFIRAWEPGRVRIADRWVAGNVIVGSDRNHRRLDDERGRTA